jgi:hypothetical protein
MNAFGGNPAVDRDADRLLRFLEAEGAGEMPHAFGRSLLDHLLGTYAILRRWRQPDWLARAALAHSIYGTDRYRDRLLPASRRSEVSELAGAQAERIAYLFSAVPRGPLLAGTYRWAPAPVDGSDSPSRDELDGLVLLHMANIAEQARAPDGSPGSWLADMRELAERVLDSETIVLPIFIAKLATFSQEDETLVRRAYRVGLGSVDSSERGADRLALAASLCPVIGEPCIWQAYLACRRRDFASAARWARTARGRLLELGVAWDKRLTFEQWRELAEVLVEAHAVYAACGHPGELFEAVVKDSARASAARRPRVNGPTKLSEPPADGGRFQRYIATLAEEPSGRIYPNLSSRPWFDPADFPLANYLEGEYPAIRREILSLSSSTFHRETERIQRIGDWDVAFFYERGRRHHDVCEACPVTTRGIEGHGAIPTMAGLAYVSRMRAGTQIAAHRGPTNLRLRCHLGIQVPEGDCAIRVGRETRAWEEGRCLVFDDHFEHEAWNHTDEDRVVLIADVWHPELSSTEVSLLEGLHNYASFHALKLSRYWAANAAAADAER